MNRMAKWLVKHRVVVVIICLLLMIPSIMGMTATKVKYDLLYYLPQDLDNVAFPFGQSVKGFGKQFIFDEYIKAGHLKTEIIAFVFVRCEKLREFAFAQIRKSYFACCAFRKSAAVAFRFADQSFLC